MIRCDNPEKEQWVRAYDLLDSPTKAKLEEHLENCPWCRNRLAFFKAFEDLSSGGHPSADEMIRLAESERGDSGAEEMSLENTARVRAHIDHCGECGELLRILQGRDDLHEKPDHDSEVPMDSAHVKALALRFRSLWFDEDGDLKDQPNETLFSSTSIQSRRWILALTAIACAFLLIMGFHGSCPLNEDTGFLSVRIVGLDMARSIDKVRDTPATTFFFMAQDSFYFSCNTHRSAWIYSFVLDPKAVYPDNDPIRETDAAAGFMPLTPRSWDEPLFHVSPGESIHLPDDVLGFTIDGESGDLFYIALLAAERPLDESMFAETIDQFNQAWIEAKKTGRLLEEAILSYARLESDCLKLYTLITK